MSKEITIQLPNGGSMVCGGGVDHEFGGSVTICDAQGNEILYWDSDEWEEEGQGELVMGAIFKAAVTPIQELIKDRVLRREPWYIVEGCKQIVVGERGVWVHKKP